MSDCLVYSFGGRSQSLNTEKLLFWLNALAFGRSLIPPFPALFPLLELTRFIDYYPRVIRLLLSGIKIGNWLAKVASLPCLH